MNKLSTKIIPLILILFVGLLGGYFLGGRKQTPASAPKDMYASFLLEVYDKIKDNYWSKLSDGDLAGFYAAGLEKVTGQNIAKKPKDKAALETLLAQTIKNLDSNQKKKDFSTQLADVVLSNLQPFGRSRLYSQKEETALKNTVANINPEVNQYQALGVKKNASEEEVKKVYEQKTEELKKVASPEAKTKLAQLQKAYQVLSDKDSRKVYDQSGVEPTMEYKLLRPDIFYIHLNKFSPTTIDELVRVTQKVDTGDILDTLILDLRDNIGGAIDGLPYFLGPFIGNDQYAYQFFHQGEKEDFKTKVGFLPSMNRYKKIVTLINGGTQSTAEVMAATLKKYNVGVLVGSPTKGWGTVERVFTIDAQIDPTEKYSVFLVHRLTLREDGQPIDGRGVEPAININDPNWEKQLYSRYHYDELIKAVKEVY